LGIFISRHGSAGFMKVPNMPLHPTCIPLRPMQSGERGR